MLDVQKKKLKTELHIREGVKPERGAMEQERERREQSWWRQPLFLNKCADYLRLGHIFTYFTCKSV